MHFMDVGYGDAIFIQFPGSGNMMVDAGENVYSDVIIKYLEALEVKAIDTAVITHPHTNHFGGFAQVGRRFPIGRVFINGDNNTEVGYEALLSQFEQGRIPIETLRRGQNIDGLPGGIEIEVLHPEGLTGSPNDNSIVLRLKYNKIAVLLMADVDLGPQKELIGAFPGLTQADAVKVPHHGGPLSDEFIKAFENKVFIISTGVNQWGWPREKELSQLKGRIYRTDQDGTVVLESNGISFLLSTADAKKN
jgi:competence protein ComEC